MTDEPVPIRRVNELNVLQARHQGHRRGGWLEGVERGTDRGIADRMNLAGDAGFGGPSDEAGELLGSLPEHAQVGRSLAGLKKGGGA